MVSAFLAFLLPLLLLLGEELMLLRIRCSYSQICRCIQSALGYIWFQRRMAEGGRLGVSVVGDSSMTDVKAGLVEI